MSHLKTPQQHMCSAEEKKIIKLLRIQQLVYLPNFAPGTNIFLVAHRLPPGICVTGQQFYQPYKTADSSENINSTKCLKYVTAP